MKMLLLKCPISTTYSQLNAIITRKNDQELTDRVYADLIFPPTSKERRIFYKCLLISAPHLSVWETRLLGSLFVGSVHAWKVLPLYFWRGMHPAERAMSPASLCAARQRKDLFLSGVKTEREPRSWRTRYAPSRISGWLSQLSLQL